MKPKIYFQQASKELLAENQTADHLAIIQIEKLFAIPQSWILVCYQPEFNRLSICLQSDVARVMAQENNHIVSLLDISGLSPYFVFLEEQKHLAATEYLLNLIMQVCKQIFHTDPNHSGYLPKEVRNLYSDAVWWYKTIEPGIVTEVFRNKLLTLLKQIWKHWVSFLRFVTNHQNQIIHRIQPVDTRYVF